MGESRRSVIPEMGRGRRDGAVIICVCRAAGRSSRGSCVRGLRAGLDQSTAV